jgi:hypothetical protein
MGKNGFDARIGLRAMLDAGGPVVDASLHVDADAICPRCLTWITPRDYVRRTLFDLLQHETCPPPRRAGADPSR